MPIILRAFSVCLLYSYKYDKSLKKEVKKITFSSVPSSSILVLILAFSYIGCIVGDKTEIIMRREEKREKVGKITIIVDM